MVSTLLALCLVLQGCRSAPLRRPVSALKEPCTKVSAFTTKDHVEHPFFGRACLYSQQGEDMLMMESSQLKDSAGRPRRWSYRVSSVESITVDKSRVVGAEWWKNKKVHWAAFYMVAALGLFALVTSLIPDNHPFQIP